jgi:hypothetical protein
MFSFSLFFIFISLKFWYFHESVPECGRHSSRASRKKKGLKTAALDHKKSDIIALFLFLYLQQITLSQYVNEMSNYFIPLNLKYT